MSDPFIIEPTTTSSINWEELTGQNPGFHNTNQIMVSPPAVEITIAMTPPEDIPLDVYNDADLRVLRDRIEKRLGPKPPKFNSVEEADTWMETHYGQ